MPDEWDQFKSKPAQGGDEFDQYKSKPATSSATPQDIDKPEMGFGERMGQTVFGMAKELGHTALGLVELADKVNPATYLFPSQHKQQTEFNARLGKTLQPTNPSQEAGYGAAQFLEFFVPTGTGEIKAAASAPRWVKMLVGAGREAVDIGMKTFVQTQDPKKALKAAGIAAPFGAAGGLLSRAKVFDGVQSRLSPKEAASIGEVQARGVPTNLGDVTGNKAVQTGVQRLGLTPGAIGPMARHQAAQRTAGATALEQLPASLPGRLASEVEAGVDVEVGIGSHVTDLKKVAKTEYDIVRAEARAARQSVQIGTKTQRVVGFNPVAPASTPIMADVEFPVVLPPIRNSLRPFFEELAGKPGQPGRLSQTVKDASPGFAVLKRIVEGDEKMVDALDLDRDLSVVKGFLRKYGKDLKDQSGRYSAIVVKQLEDGVQQAIGGSPNVVKALEKGRDAVKQYHAASELLSRLLPEKVSPSVVVERLTQQSGRYLPDLKELKRIVPQEVDTVAKTYMQGLVQDIMANGRLENLKTGLNKFRGLQPEVREILYGRQAEKIDNLLQGLLDIGADTNPSGTGKWAAIAEAMGIVTGTLTALGTGHVGAAAGIAATGAVEMVAANRLAKMVTSPEGIKWLTQAVRLPQSSWGFNKALQALGAMSVEDDTPAQ
jgi:hypothetical protein